MGTNKLHPNIFVFIVGPPGVGKTQAAKPMMELLRKAKCCTLSPNDISKQSLLDALGEASKAVLIDTTPVEYHYLALIILEMSNFMSKYDMELAGLLTDLFDCPDTNEEKKRTHNKGKLIMSPGLSALVCTATQNLGSTISNEMWGSGFMARFILVFSGEEIVPEDMFKENVKEEALAEEIVTRLKQLGELKGTMDWTPDARDALQRFRLTSRDTAPIHNRLAHYTTRRWMHLAKLCMIAALAEGRMEVQLDDFALGESWLLDAEADMPEIFKDMVAHEDGQILEELRSHFFMIHMRSQKRPIPHSSLYDWLRKRASAFATPKLLEVALAADHFRRVAGTSGDDSEYIPQPPRAPDLGVI